MGNTILDTNTPEVYQLFPLANVKFCHPEFLSLVTSLSDLIKLFWFLFHIPPSVHRCLLGAQAQCQVLGIAVNKWALELYSSRATAKQ